MSSVATITFESFFESRHCEYTLDIMEDPLILINGFPGNRVEANLAGIIPKIFIGECNLKYIYLNIKANQRTESVLNF